MLEVMSIKEQKQQIAAVFDDVATRYDKNRFFSISAQQLVSYLDFSGAKKLLDVSTGTGEVAIQVAEKCPSLDIVAIDISTEMLRQAQQKARAKNLKIKFSKGDVEKIQYQTATFDIITCGYGLFFFPEINNTFKKLYRALKSGGQFAFSSFTHNAFTPFEKLFAELLKTYQVEIPKLAKTKLQTPEQIYDLCQEVGVKDISITSQQIRYKVTVNDWWSLLNSAGYKGLLTQVGEDKIIEFKKRHLSEVTEMSNQGKILLKADSHYVVCCKE